MPESNEGRKTHRHVIGYLDTILKYVESDITDAQEKVDEAVKGSYEWTFHRERLFGYQSSKRYLEGAKDMALLEQKWNAREREAEGGTNR